MSDVGETERRSGLELFISCYCERTRSSKAYRERFGAVLADSRASAGELPPVAQPL